MIRVPPQHQQRQRSFALVMRALRQLREASRSDLAERTGLNRSTLTRLAVELIEAGLVAEGGEAPASAKGGRRRQLLHLSNGRYGVCGCDVQHLYADWCLVGLSGEAIGEGRIDRPSQMSDVSQWLRWVPSVLVESIRADMSDPPDVLGFGVGVPGLLNQDRETLVNSTALGVQNVHLAQPWAEVASAVRIDNDANCGAWNLVWETEQPVTAVLSYPRIHRLGGGVVAPSGAGIGLSIVIDGEIHYGSTGAAGELRGYNWSRDSSDTLGAGLGHAHRESGDEGMIRLLATEILRNIGVIATAIDPDRVVISGDLAGRQETLEAVLRSELRDSSWTNPELRRRLEFARPAQYPVALGAARMVLHEYYRLPSDGETQRDRELDWFSILDARTGHYDG